MNGADMNVEPANKPSPIDLLCSDIEGQVMNLTDILGALAQRLGPVLAASERVVEDRDKPDPDRLVEGSGPLVLALKQHVQQIAQLRKRVAALIDRLEV
jgi:hypothetical protein